jgi:hypothetical protein
MEKYVGHHILLNQFPTQVLKQAYQALSAKISVGGGNAKVV